MASEFNRLYRRSVSARSRKHGLLSKGVRLTAKVLIGIGKLATYLVIGRL